MTGRALAEILLKTPGVLFLARSAASIPLFLQHLFVSGTRPPGVPWRVAYAWNFGIEN